MQRAFIEIFQRAGFRMSLLNSLSHWPKLNDRQLLRLKSDAA
jgi:hypothetical protein